MLLLSMTMVAMACLILALVIGFLMVIITVAWTSVASLLIGVVMSLFRITRPIATFFILVIPLAGVCAIFGMVLLTLSLYTWFPDQPYLAAIGVITGFFGGGVIGAVTGLVLSALIVWWRHIRKPAQITESQAQPSL